MKRLLVILLSLPMAVSCHWIARIEHVFHESGDPTVANVGYEYLYRSDIAKLLPSGISPEDSVRLSASYIESWAYSKLIMLKAEESLSEKDKDISGDIEAFRQNLLTFRYEKYYIEHRIDTLVTQEKLREVYEANKADYTFPYSIVRGRVIRISKKSPYYDGIKERYCATSPQDVEDLVALCNSTAEKYADFSQSWTPSSSLAKELGTDLREVESLLARSRAFEYDSGDGHYLVFIQDRTAPGQPSPLEYNAEKIREIIISYRKQELLSSLRNELLDEGRGNGKLKLYTEDE